MQEFPICIECDREIRYDQVFEALCGHDECPSSVFHGLCLMTWREKRAIIEQKMAAFIRAHREIFGDMGDD